MKHHLSDSEVRILLAATLMNESYPFARSQPYLLNPAEEVVVHSTVERLCSIRRENHEHSMYDPRPVELSHEEVLTLEAIIQSCLKECNGNNTSIHLHLQAENEDEVRELIDRLRTIGDS